MCRSRRELSNAYLLAKFGFDTAENEPSKVGPSRPAQGDKHRSALRIVAALEERQCKARHEKQIEDGICSVLPGPDDQKS